MKTNNKEKVIDALLSTSTITDAAKQAGVAEATIYRYLRDETFKNEYRNARRDVVENTIGQLQGATAQAVETLTKNLDCGNPSAEIRAAQIILETSYKGIELIDLQMRVELLEADQERLNSAVNKK
jgi:AcrR family transcriptional regulator